MNGRQRIMAAVAHQEPDKIPKDLGATPSSGISAIAYRELLNYLGMGQTEVKIYDVVQQLAQVDDAILDCYGIDVVDVGRNFAAAQDWKPFTPPGFPPGTSTVPAWFRPQPCDGGFLVCQNGVQIARMPVGATFFDQTIFPYADGYPKDYKGLPEAMSKVLWSALVHSPWDRAGETDFYQTLRRNALKLREETDRALMIVCGCNLFEWGTFLRGIDNFLCDLLLEPEEVERLLDALMELHLATLERVCDAVGDVCDILRFGDDLGMDSGPLMQPEIYRELFKPRHTMLTDYVHRNSGMRTFLHSCGSLYKLLPDLIEAGYDIINPVQISSRDMEPERLKREFGKDITFWGGGCDTRNILNRGSVAQVRDHVKHQIETLMPGGGFVFSAVHNIMPDCPPENIEAMFETAEAY